MTQVTQGDTSPNGNTTNSIRARIWSITINNYTDEDVTLWTQLLEGCEKYIWQYERGNSGTPHIQGHIVFKNPRTLKSLKTSLPRAHIEKVRNIKASEEYCQKQQSKDGECFIKGYDIIPTKSLEERLLEIEYNDVIWRDWQQDVINIIEAPVDKRKVHWYWEATGNVGKSFLAKYLCLKYDCIIATGKTGDIFNQLLNWRNTHPDELQLPPILIDNPRSEFGHINYSALEQLKNGFIYSGKYEGGKVFGLSPHVIVFANSNCDTTQLSRDRIVSVCLHDDHLDSDLEED